MKKTQSQGLVKHNVLFMTVDDSPCMVERLSAGVPKLMTWIKNCLKGELEGLLNGDPGRIEHNITFRVMAMTDAEIEALPDL